jgi:hypothetical protein
MNEYRARPYGGGAGGGSNLRSKKKRKASKRPPAFNGVVALSAAEYARIEECTTNPGEPTEAARRGADLLRKLYG